MICGSNVMHCLPWGAIMDIMTRVIKWGAVMFFAINNISPEVRG